MSYFIVKTLVSALVIAAVSEVARRSSVFAALVASLPLTSVLAFLWLYRDTRDLAKVAELSTDILWLVLPSLVFFAAFPLAARAGMGFAASLTASLAVMGVAYALGLTAVRVFK